MSPTRFDLWISVEHPAGLPSSRIYLDPEEFLAGNLDSFDGWDEQCVSCGTNIVENGSIVETRTLGLCVRCGGCGDAYPVRCTDEGQATRSLIREAVKAERHLIPPPNSY